MTQPAHNSTNEQPRIRFCVNNPRGLDERNALLAAGHECLGCLGNCTRCFEVRFLEIENRFIEGESYEEIIDRSSNDLSD